MTDDVTQGPKIDGIYEITEVEVNEAKAADDLLVGVAHADAGDALDLHRRLLSAVESQNAVLAQAVAAINGVHPEVQMAVKTQRRAVRFMIATLALVILSFGIVAWQRQNTVRQTLSTQCERENTSREVARNAWKIAWPAIEKGSPSDQLASIRIVEAQQAATYAPKVC